MEADGVRKDGRRFEIELRYLPILHAGEPHALAVGRDISERRERERALQRSEAQYRAIFDASSDALVLRDAEFRIVDVNATYESHHRPHARRSRRRRPRARQPGGSRAHDPRVAPARACTASRSCWTTPLVRRDGRATTCELRGVPILHRGQPHVRTWARHHRAPRGRAAARASSRRSCARRRRWRRSASSPAASRTTSTTS